MQRSEDTIDLRIPAWNVAALVLLACGMAAINFYTTPGIGARVVTILAGVAALVVAVIAYRMYLVVDDEGVGVRGPFRTHSVTWAELDDVGIIERKPNTMRLQLALKDGRVVDIPQSLTTPGRPESKPKARTKLATLGRRILDYPETHETSRG